MPTIVTVGTEDDDYFDEEEKAKILQEEKVFSTSMTSSTIKDNLEASEGFGVNEEDGMNDELFMPEVRESTDIIKNRIESSMGGIYGITSDTIEDEDMLDREIREMRKSATGIVDDLDGLIDRGDQIPGQRTEYLTLSPFASSDGKESPNSIPILGNVHRKVTWESATPSPESEKDETNRVIINPPSQQTNIGIKIELPVISLQSNTVTQTVVEEHIQDRIENNLSPLTDTYDIDSRASSSMSSDSSSSPQLQEQDPEALAKTMEDETFRRYLKISPEERERLKNREAELPIKFDDFIAIHGFSAEKQKLKNEKRNDHISDSITFIDQQHFSYHYEKFSESSDEKSNIPSKNAIEKSSRPKKNKKRRKKKTEEVIDMDHVNKTLSQEQINEQRKINKQLREERKKRQANREKKVSELEKQSKKSQEMYEKADRRSKIFSEWMEQQGIITEDVANLIPRLSEKDFQEEEESSSSKSFFITDVNDTTHNYVEKRKQKEKQKSLFAVPQTFDPSNYDRKSKLSDLGSVLDQKYGPNNKDGSSSSRMPSISRGSNKSVGFLTFWNKSTIPKRPAVREITSLTSNRDIGNMLSIGVGREHLPKIV